MEDMTRRAALGMAAAGAAALATVGTVEASPVEGTVPQEFGRCVGITGGQGNFCLLFVNEETGAVHVLAYSPFGAGVIIKAIQRT
jgi:hypothetical protein